jgi:hypothetical protein
MPTNTETKHARFLRLAQRRLTRAKEELRLIGQLASPNYENTPEEAKEIVRILDGDVRNIAGIFEVEYASRIGKASTKTTNGAQPIGGTFRKVHILDEIEIVRVLEHLRIGRIEEATSILRSAVTGTGKAA